MKRPPSRIEPYENLPDVLDFPRDIQPILDRHCVECHNHDRYDGDINLSGDRTPIYSTAYWTMFSKSLVVDGRNKYGNRPPRTIGTSASRLMTCLDESHHDVKLTEQERYTIRTWIDSGAALQRNLRLSGKRNVPRRLPRTDRHQPLCRMPQSNEEIVPQREEGRVLLPVRQAGAAPTAC
jgi:hypothetical protein